MKKIAIASLALITLAPAFTMQPADALSKKEKVKLVRAVDGDTFDVKKGSKVVRVRLLLTDTPESVKPGVKVQPYSKEAKAYAEHLMRGRNVYIQYDKGGRTDKYGRDLVYLYAGNYMVNEQLIKNGFARVGYVYSQREFLPKLNKAQSIAKNKRIRIWRTSGYVNPYGEGFLTDCKGKAVKTPAKKVTKPATKVVKQTAKPVVKKTVKTGFKNCTELRLYYKNGVPRGHAAYQPKMDRDNDGWACER